MPKIEEERESRKKDVIMRAKAGTINFSFPNENEAKDWENRIASKLKDDGYKIKEAGRGAEATSETQGLFRQDTEKKSETAPRGAAGDVLGKGEVAVKRSGKDLDVLFSNEKEAKYWENRIASKLKDDGYRIKEAGRSGEATSETQGLFRQDTEKKSETAPRGAAGDVLGKGEVAVKRSGKDLEVSFSNEKEAKDWESSVRSMIEESGYRLSIRKPVAGKAAEAAGYE